ncbi:MAG: hypothetical protein CVT49_06520 [candidate division Zixibacteria bacterium HGW-Zixibacteria-1]|nr:MAG: hypothetical protein CVT49_06520 [candidate division Zixibacteria bacterium HGW-Zixibacteria-1]
MKINCSINGKAVPNSRAKISVFDNSLFYADGLFETLLAIGDKVIFLDDHLDRLEKGAALIGINLPVTRDKIRQWINAANLKNSAPVKKVRVTVTAGDSAFWAGKRTDPRIIVIVTEYEIPTQPFRLTVSPFRVDQHSPFRNVKTLSFIIEMTSRKRAYSESFDDGILLNRKGNVAEATSANLFWVKDGVLFTTPLTAGCLEGMTRKHIIELAKTDKIPIKIKDIKLADFLKSDEIFVTSSLKLILPVISITADKKFTYKAGLITNKMKARLWEFIS